MEPACLSGPVASSVISSCLIGITRSSKLGRGLWSAVAQRHWCRTRCTICSPIQSNPPDPKCCKPSVQTPDKRGGACATKGNLSVHYLHQLVIYRPTIDDLILATACSRAPCSRRGSVVRLPRMPRCKRMRGRMPVSGLAVV
ncbi:hypothetical protein V8C40DRAFT_238529 [Trichoderma camerunense]